MRTFYFTLLISLFISSTAIGQNSKNLDLVGKKTYSSNLSDVWGYVANDGTEYALVGVRDGLSIVSVATPSTPIEVVFVRDSTSTWRDMKVWGDFAYVTNESDGGMMIVNLKNLPNSVTTSRWGGSGNVSFTSAHNIFIDEKGYGYIVGANYRRGGAIVVDLFTNPGKPILKTVYNGGYIHDIFVRGDTMWNAEINNGYFAIIDISDKSQATVPPSKTLATHFTSMTFTHNVWLSDDGKTLFTTDERSGAFITAYDVSDLQNISELDRIQSSPGNGVIPHNVFVNGDFLVTSYYRDGVTIMDASHPDNIIQTGYYDSSPFSGSGFNGSWGTFPYFPSGLVLDSDIEGGLLVLRPKYIYACYLEGNVKDSISGAPIMSAKIEIINQADANTQSNLLGDYKTGVADSGTYQVMFSKLGYKSKTVSNVSLDNGTTTTVNVELVKKKTFSYTGKVIAAATGIGIPGAIVQAVGPDTIFKTVTNNNGEFTLTGVFSGTYDVMAGKWGYISKLTPNIPINSGGQSTVIVLGLGYYDDFAMDFKWQVNSTASTGIWERGEPIGTYSGSNEVNPEFDVANDLGDQAYVTGNGGGGIGSDDVDNGVTTLESPIFDISQYNDPYITFYKWFVNFGGAGSPDDSLKVILGDGQSEKMIDMSDANSLNGIWIKKTFRINDFFTPGSLMYAKFITSDLPTSGHIVEAAVDFFRVFDSISTPPAAKFNADFTSGCAPLTVQFSDSSAIGITNWTWSLPGSDIGSSNLQNPLAVYATPGTYQVKLWVKNPAGVDSIIKINYITVFDNPDFTTSGIASSQSANTGKAWITIVSGQAPYTYLWDDPNAQQTDTATNLAPGTYHVTVTDDNGCSSVDSVVIGVNTGIGQNESDYIQVFPNPFVNNLTLQYHFNELKEPARIQVFDLTGRLVYNNVINKTEGNISIESIITPGTYLLQINNNSGILFVKRLVKLE
jgi:choice-of-anchor B domain-containing protein